MVLIMLPRSPHQALPPQPQLLSNDSGLVSEDADVSSENETQRSVKATFALPSGCVNDLYQLSILLKTVMTEEAC